MNVLFFGSDELLARVRAQRTGQNWDVHRADGPEQIKDYQKTHTFQAAIIGLCLRDQAVLETVTAAKEVLKIPVVIGLASMDDAQEFASGLPRGADVVLTGCGQDSLTKAQCDALLRFANGVRAENVVSGEVTFHTSRDTFSVNGREILLPRKQHKLLELLFLKIGRTVTTDMVFNHLYGWNEPPSEKIVEVFICKIRRKLREAGMQEDIIQTVWGHGYSLRHDVASQDVKAA